MTGFGNRYINASGSWRMLLIFLHCKWSWSWKCRSRWNTCWWPRCTWLSSIRAATWSGCSSTTPNLPTTTAVNSHSLWTSTTCSWKARLSTPFTTTSSTTSSFPQKTTPSSSWASRARTSWTTKKTTRKSRTPSRTRRKKTTTALSVTLSAMAPTPSRCSWPSRNSTTTTSSWVWPAMPKCTWLTSRPGMWSGTTTSSGTSTALPWTRVRNWWWWALPPAVWGSWTAETSTISRLCRCSSSSKKKTRAWTWCSSCRWTS